MAYNWYRGNCISRADRWNARWDYRRVAHRIAIQIQAHTQWTFSDVRSQLPTTPKWSFKGGDRQNEKKQWNCDQRAGSDPPPVYLSWLGRSASTPTKRFWPDGIIFCWCSFTMYRQRTCVICFWHLRPLQFVWRSQGCQSIFSPVDFQVPCLEPWQAQDLMVCLHWDD